MFEVHYVLPSGKHFCVVCDGEQALKSFVVKLRREARIMSNGVHVGRVWKDGTRWNWFFDPSLVTPNKACTGRACPNCHDTETIIRYGIEQCASCGYPARQ